MMNIYISFLYAVLSTVRDIPSLPRFFLIQWHFSFFHSVLSLVIKGNLYLMWLYPARGLKIKKYFYSSMCLQASISLHSLSEQRRMWSGGNWLVFDQTEYYLNHFKSWWGKVSSQTKFALLNKAAYIKMLLINNILSLKPLSNSCTYILNESGLEVFHISI